MIAFLVAKPFHLRHEAERVCIGLSNDQKYSSAEREFSSTTELSFFRAMACARSFDVEHITFHSHEILWNCQDCC